MRNFYDKLKKKKTPNEKKKTKKKLKNAKTKKIPIKRFVRLVYKNDPSL